jgi:3-deoxy-D-manno-octulosonic-acid transferase
MLISFLYEIALWILSLAMIPWLFYQSLVKRKYRESLEKKFGHGFPSITKGTKRLIWVHAVSMGEMRALAAFARSLKEQEGNPLLLVSCTTETGYAEAKRSLSFADYHVYLPFDFRSIIAPIVKKTAPDLVILCESDFWYNFFSSCKKSGATIALVNGKISKRSLKRFQLFPYFSKRLFGFLDIACVQNDLYKKRFEQLGIPPHKLVVTGNIKFDEAPTLLTEKERISWKEELGIPPQAPILVIGSTHEPEERLFLEKLKEVWERFPSLRVLIVPRHPERFSTVASLLEGLFIPYIRFSQIAKKQGTEQLFLVDAMGILRKCYQLADIAIVGGSYTPKVGGHNIIEPCPYGVPVLFGPYMHTQSELVDLVKQHHAGLQVEEEALSSVLIDLLSHPEKRQELGAAGQRLVGEMRGAIRRTWQAITALNPCSKAD